MKDLRSKIEGIEVGDLLDLFETVTFGGVYQVRCVTPKAILVGDSWIPKSCIVDVEEGVEHKGVWGSDDTISVCKRVNISQWIDEKLERERPVRYGY